MFGCSSVYQLKLKFNLLCSVNSDIVLLLIFHLGPLWIPDWENVHHLMFLFWAVLVYRYCYVDSTLTKIKVENKYIFAIKIHPFLAHL